MRPATAPRSDAEATRLLLTQADAPLRHCHMADLPSLLEAGDVLVVNDAATLPASLAARTEAGQPIELRLATAGPDGDWWAVAFGAGDWRQRTEDRAPPPPLPPGSEVAIAPGLRAQVREVAPLSPRLLRIRFEAQGPLWAALYAAGRPVQYAYMEAPLALWDVQTPYRSRPWAVEMPSAGRALTAALVQKLRGAGVVVSWLTHGAGLSSTGDPALDAALPLPERYEIPSATAAAVRAARAEGRRVVAVGTTVVRALETAAAEGGVRAGAGVSTLRLGAGRKLRAVDGILTGLHAPGTSHYDVLACLAPPSLLGQAWREAEAAGYRDHEFGDALLLLPPVAPAGGAA